jgi:thiamine kinase-like enzyme
LTLALDALIALQRRYWSADEKRGVGLSFSEALERRIDRGRYLGDDELEAAYGHYIERFKTAPRTLCHDDLLPFNVLVSERRATLIDWEVAGILPYLTPLARLIAHGREDDGAFFYMKDEDKAFAVDYYYENLAKEKGISREEYLRDVDLFLLYEYCEWIMLGVKYEDADMERYREYYALAKAHLKRI